MTDLQPPPDPQPAAPAYIGVPEQARRQGAPWWVWLIVGGAVAVIGVVAAGVWTFLKVSEGYSPDYAGAPVEASDASATTIVSDEASVAYSIGADWVETGDYVDPASLTAGMPEGMSLVGAHYTADPTVAVPEGVLVFEAAPEAGVMGSLDPAITGMVDGMRSSGIVVDDYPTPTDYTTANGLEGITAVFDAELMGTPMTLHVAVLGHGHRTVLVEWMSFNDADGEAGFTAIVESLRIDE